MLNPCKNCSRADVRVDSDFVYCPSLECDDNRREHDGRLQNAIAAWNTANPTNDAKMKQNEALEAVQQALAAVLFERFALDNAPIYRDDLWGCHIVATNLLIAQGVLVEIDGRITLK